MSAVFAHASARSRREPVPNVEAATVNAINKAYAHGVTVGDRSGYVRGWRWGLLTGAFIGIYAAWLALWLLHKADRLVPLLRGAGLI